MARCWSCGAEIAGGPGYICSHCGQIAEGEITEIIQLEGLRRGVDEVHKNLGVLTRVQREGFDKLASRLSEVASVIEWGFEELRWQLEQQTEVLQSIDKTLKTPSETQANEWRQMAEELRNRGVLKEAESFFLKAVEADPLDYRIYIGLAQTYLQLEKFDRAKAFLEKSLPHALLEIQSEEKDEEYAAYSLPFDYKSYSYRLIGRIYFCEENYDQAALVLEKSIKLSPHYWEGHYDYAQYCALVDKKESCLGSLRLAVSANPLYFYLAGKERNFTPFRGEVDNLLEERKAEVLHEAEEAISLAEKELSKVRKAIPVIHHAFLRSVGWSESQIKEGKISEKDRSHVIETKKIYDKAQALLQEAKGKIPVEDYEGLLEAKHLALEAKALAIEALGTADKERKNFEAARAEQERARKAEKKKNVPVALFFLLVGLVFIAGGILLDQISASIIAGVFTVLVILLLLKP